MAESYRVVVASPDDKTIVLTCPEDCSAAGAQCTRRGVVLTSPLVETQVTVKAHGYSFGTARITEEDVDRGSSPVELSPLPAPQVDAAYRTGFGREKGKADFLELAVRADTELGVAHSVKFYIADYRTAPIVYFQNTRRYPQHFDFARDVLGVAFDPVDFGRRTYEGEARDAVAGTLVYRPSFSFSANASTEKLEATITLEFLPDDDISPAMVLTAHRLIEERLGFVEFSGAKRRLVYLPAGSVQEASLATEKGTFRRADALWTTGVEMYGDITEQHLNPGVAYGTLRRLTPEELQDTVVSYRDILVLTRMPNDVPLVGGTLTEELQTPLAHVNVAARARGTPNASLLSAGSDPRVAPLLDELVRFEVTSSGFTLEKATRDEAEQFWDSRNPEQLVPTSDVGFTGLPSFEELGFGDAARVGTKAANLAELRRVLGDTAPPGLAVPFSAYETYMTTNGVNGQLCDEAKSDCVAGGIDEAPCEEAHTTCDQAAASATSYSEYVDALLDDDGFATNTAVREASLDGLVYLVRNGTIDADFGAALDARIAEVLGDDQVRLRSSSNAEDLVGFNGAGLYDSVSARTTGTHVPSDEIRKVWASLWNWRAFEERAFWNVDQSAVRMGVAVNPAYDDELMNGVLITRNLSNAGAEGVYVNIQEGEVSVTNPQGSELPEVLTVLPAPGQGEQVSRDRFSSLCPNEALMTDEELVDLADVANDLAAHFAVLYDVPANKSAFEIEFKLLAPGRELLIKQVRPYPAD